MPNSKHAVHPSGKLGITFTENNHQYIDDWGIEYVSCTTLVHSAFEKFDAQKTASMKSAKTGVPPEQYIKEWQEYGEARAELGTRTHENCERQILCRYNEMHQPVDSEEKARFKAAWFEVEQLKRIYEHLEPEKLVFSPRFRIAGSIDVLARRRDGSFSIIDWKFIKTLRMTAFSNKRGIHLATQHLPDCNYFHYALQTNIYEHILKTEGYISPETAVDKYLAVYDFAQRRFNFVRMPELVREAFLLMAFNATSDNLEYVPF